MFLILFMLLLCIYIGRKADAYLSVPWVAEKVLLVTAHPDDESMFFLPTVRALRNRCEVSLLCLTNGQSPPRLVIVAARL